MIENNCAIINGIKIYPFTSIEELLDCAYQKKGILIAINAEKILHATDLTRTIINNNIGYCDGAGAVLAMKKHKCYNVKKIPGCELWLNIIRLSYKAGKTFYFVGGKQEVIEETISKLKKEFNGINIIGYRDGYINSEQEEQALIDDITQKKPDFVFVAMGSPKQEILMSEMLKVHTAIYQGLGGSFDVYIGKVKRAPKWWVNHNMEFLYRLIKEPSRIKRQIHLIRFFFMVKLGKI